jgi:hypothetical protein
MATKTYQISKFHIFIFNGSLIIASKLQYKYSYFWHGRHINGLGFAKEWR